ELVIEARADEVCRFTVELTLRQQDGMAIAFAPGAGTPEAAVHLSPGPQRLRCALPAFHVAAGSYAIDVALRGPGWEVLAQIESALNFQVDAATLGSGTWEFKQEDGQGCFLWPVTYGVDATRERPRPHPPG